jgi:hypothetical protein
MAEYNAACIAELKRRIGICDADYKAAKAFIAADPQLKEVPSDGIFKVAHIPIGAYYLLQKEHGLYMIFLQSDVYLSQK